MGGGDQNMMQYSKSGRSINVNSCIMMIHFGLYFFPKWPCYSIRFLATDE